MPTPWPLPHSYARQILPHPRPPISTPGVTPVFKDVVKTPTGYGLSVFWTKTRQKATVPEVIPLPRMKDSIICPTAAWKSYKKRARGVDMSGPLLVITPAQGKSGPEIIDLPLLSSVFKLAARQAGPVPSVHTAQSQTGGGGGSLACYQQGASVPDLMHHGTWALDSIWNYLAREAAPHSSVMHAWQQVAANTAGSNSDNSPHHHQHTTTKWLSKQTPGSRPAQTPDTHLTPRGTANKPGQCNHTRADKPTHATR